MSDTVVIEIARESSTPMPSFRKLLKPYREALGLTQRDLAPLLGVDASTIARVESGTRKPPEDPEFYWRLSQVPGLGETELAALVNATDVPWWMADLLRTLQDHPRWAEAACHGAERVEGTRLDTTPTNIPPRFARIAESGLEISLHLRSNTDEYAEDELESLKDAIHQEVQLVARQFLRRHKRRTALVSAVFEDESVRITIPIPPNREGPTGEDWRTWKELALDAVESSLQELLAEDRAGRA